MKRICYSSKLANIFLYFSSCLTITIGPFVLSKLSESEMPQYVRNHECTHSRQWIETTVASGFLLFLFIALVGINAWWMVLSAFVFYLWYGVEWLVRLCLLKDGKKAYRAVSFEQEAYANERNMNYAENAGYFSWVKYLL